MGRMRHRWNVAPALEDAVVRAEQWGLSRKDGVLLQCLWNRGCRDRAEVEAFLDPKLKFLWDPFELPGMGAAVDRLMQARRLAEPLVVFGDYDVDGVTSAALLSEVLGALGWRVEVYLPNRLDEGYGLGVVAARNCLRQHPTRLILAVDCGTTSNDAIAELSELGVDVVVVDHHQPGVSRPRAVALVNPHCAEREGGGGKELCSVGLSFKLAHALTKRCREEGVEGADAYDLRELLDLVALGTVADLVPLVGENRILVSAGLKRLRSTTRPGLVALKQVSLVGDAVGVHEVGFQLGPRLNAAGRLETAMTALSLLRASSVAEALPLAEGLDLQNRERQKIERKIVDGLMVDLRARFDAKRDFMLVEGHEDWHPGVLGIVASRVMRAFYRPALILGGGPLEWKGSGRSIEGFDLAAALEQCGGLLLKHGGHAMAAGVTMEPSRLAALREELNTIVSREMARELLIPALRLDGETRLCDLNFPMLEQLDRLGPFGMGNPPIQLFTRRLRVLGSVMRMGREEQHLKFRAQDETGTHEVVWWNGAEAEFPEGPFDMAYAPSVSEYRGRRTIQLKLLDWRAC